MKRCVVAYATRDEQWMWTVEVPDEATVADVLEAARAGADDARAQQVPWETASLGIFGQPCNRTDRPTEGDRVEIYRPLASDPRERRRERVQTQRRAQRMPGRGRPSGR